MFGTPEYTEWAYNDPEGPYYVAGNQNRVVVDPASHEVNVINTQTGRSQVTGTVSVTPPEPPKPKPEPVNSGSTAVDLETGKSYDVTDPSRPVEVKPPNNVAVDTETGQTFDVTDPTRPVDITPTPKADQKPITLPSGFIGPPAPGEVVSLPSPGPSTPPPEVDQAKVDAALTKLEPYKNADGNYNINKFLLDSEKDKDKSITNLLDAGFTRAQVSAAAHQNLDVANQVQKQVDAEYSNAGVAKYTAHLVADMVIPGLSTAENWNELSGWQKVVYPALDVAVLIPVAGQFIKAGEIGLKGISVGAKVASLGGRDAVELAAKDATEQLGAALEKKVAQEALYQKAVQVAAEETKPAMKSILEGAAENAKSDLELIEKQLPKLTRDTESLQKLADTARATDTSASVGAKLYRAAEKIESIPEKTQVGMKLGNLNAKTSLENVITRGGAALISGTAAVTTIKDWNDLTPAQKAAGIIMTVLPIGVIGKARNLAEDVANPYKIPLKAAQTRTVPGEIRPGQIYSEAGGSGGGTVRLVIDPKATPEEARNSMASLMRRLHDTGETASVNYAGHEVKIPGTGFQKVVGGKASFSATPHGEVFEKGTGAFGTKTRLESYLTKVNKTLDKDKEPITIEAKYKVKDPTTGELVEKTVATDVTPGVKVAGSEGGLYTAPTVANKFAHQAAYGSKGQVQSALIIHDAGIEGLPRLVAQQKLGKMEIVAEKIFNGARDTNQIVEGFKKYRIFAEGENVITNGSQIQRTMNLRSRLAEILHQNKGEYFTRDANGRIELFQMYLEGGRTTPYTLKELYKLKGTALKNALADIGPGLNNKIRELRGKEASPVEDLGTTKEEIIANKFSAIDKSLKEGNISKNEALAAKREALEEIREDARNELRKEATETARDRALEAVRKGGEELRREITEVRDSDTGAALSRTASQQKTPAQSGRVTGDARTDDARVDTNDRTGTNQNDGRSDSGLADTGRTDTGKDTTDRTPDRSSTDRPPTNRPPTERPTAERPPTDRKPPDRPESDRPDRPETDIPDRNRPDRPPERTPLDPHLRLPKSPKPGGQTEQTDWPDGTIVWNQGKLGSNVVHHISPYPYDVEYTSFKPPKGMKNADLTTTKDTIQALGGKVLKDADLQVGFEIAHIRKGSSDIYFTQDEDLASAIQKSAATNNRRVSRLVGAAVPALGGKLGVPAAEKPYRIVKMHVTKQGGITRRSDR